MTIFQDLGVELLGELTVRFSDLVLSHWTRLHLPVTLSAHLSEIRTRLQKMPFIYRDLNTQVFIDFVSVRIETIDLETLKVRPIERGRPSTDQRMRERHKALFLGNAGIGKTTFFRHTALTLANKRHVQHFFPDEKIIPFYVPLKAVNNSHPHPIIKY